MLALVQASGREPLAVVAAIAPLISVSAFFAPSEVALFSIDDLFVAGLADDGAAGGRVTAHRRLRGTPTGSW